MTSVSRILSVAKSQVNQHFPKESPYAAWYKFNVDESVSVNDPFCAMFVSWCADRIGLWKNDFPIHAYTPSGAKWFKDRGLWRDGTKGIAAGDIVYFDFPDNINRIQHVGIVESVVGNGSIITIEGNTSSTVNGSQHNGRTVARKVRGPYIVGYGRPNYSDRYVVSEPRETNTVKVENVDMLIVDLSKVTSDSKTWIRGNKHVDNLQGLLNAAGYVVSIDNVGGPKTRDAVMAFQSKAKLVTDKCVGPKTWKALIEW